MSTTVELHPEGWRPSVLPHLVHLGAGIAATVDLADACCPWRTLTLPTASEAARSDVTSVLADLDGRPARALLRVAVLDALDRWLPVPLSQALLDAERAVARLDASTVLADGPLSRDLLDTALALARRAAPGMMPVIEGLQRHAVVTPDLCDGLDRLAAGFAALDALVSDPEGELRLVGTAWAEHGSRLSASGSDAPHPVPPPDLAGEPAGHDRTVVDPRQSWARTFALSADPDHTEVAVTADPGADAATVRAPAFGAWVPRDVLSRLMVRLVDRRSGEAGGHALLTPTGRLLTPGGHAELTATVPLYGVDPASVRADLFDALVVGPPPAAVDDDAELRAARVAVAELARRRGNAPTCPDDAARRTVAELAAADGTVRD